VKLLIWSQVTLTLDECEGGWLNCPYHLFSWPRRRQGWDLQSAVAASVGSNMYAVAEGRCGARAVEAQRVRHPIVGRGVCAGSKAAKALKTRSKAGRQAGWHKVRGLGRSPRGVDGGQSFVVFPIQRLEPAEPTLSYVRAVIPPLHSVFSLLHRRSDITHALLCLRGDYPSC